ncbi:Chase2 sensor protein [Aphanothece hegewaldii CCALA 016]|uniref:Chase2 sensor protein n=1 Tax=Aphanothece hegewaldii CCALA 016 TaxID=2107694 RepID=A0A2T1LT15_9CHRO|nr:CHASE2 domain-containing protein [Aphanothece hegewaldii]PSF33169.1 Chase2 sensor protein [Aphanothece hegewaldii CCALA 016]
MDKSQLVVLNLGKGDWKQGYTTVIAQLWQSNPHPLQFTASLPKSPELELAYQNWQLLLSAHYSSLGWRYRTWEIEIESEDVTHISSIEFQQACDELQNQLNLWLNAASFRPIERQLRTYLSPTDEIRLIIVSENRTILRFPWCIWSFFDDYPQAELAVSLPDYARSVQKQTTHKNDRIKILAILGNGQGIDLEPDRLLLEQLPNVELQFLVEPTRTDLDRHLWESRYDILFFAGHSSSQGQGKIQINSRNSLTIPQLKYALKNAIAQGLQLAIFNSCDGLGLAWDLEDLHLPQGIVMREPVPDIIAQEFLKHFLSAFARGESFYQSVREAREKLQPRETEFKCATWFPVIFQNPAQIPPTWRSLLPKIEEIPITRAKTNYQKLLINSLVVTAIIVGLRWLGMLQPLELWAFDRLMGLRPTETPDPRLLIVTVTEKDIQAQGEEARRGSLSDEVLNRLLVILESNQPRAIGLDIYRDFPVETRHGASLHPDLKTRLQKSDRLIAICKRSDGENDPTGIAAPPEIPLSRLGFSDFIADNDGILRRHLLFMSPLPVSSSCTTAYSFSVQLAFLYLHGQGISPTFTKEGNLQLKQTIFTRLISRTVGYQSIDARGSQIMLNYRALDSPRQIADQVTLSQVLKGEINPKAIKDRVILIGVTANSTADYWATPYGAGSLAKIPGVFIQAHMLSQILSAVLDNRPLLWYLPQWGEIIWIWGWSLTGGFLAFRFHPRSDLGRSGIIAGVTLSGTCFLLLLCGGWLPLVPAIFALVVTGTRIRIIDGKIEREENAKNKILD